MVEQTGHVVGGGHVNAGGMSGPVVGTTVGAAVVGTGGGAVPKVGTGGGAV